MTEHERTVLRYIDHYYNEYPEDIGTVFEIRKVYHNTGPCFIAAFYGKQNSLCIVNMSLLEAEMCIVNFITNLIDKDIR